MIQNILVIDDNEMDNFIVQRLLEKNNIAEHITTKFSAKDALHYLDELKKNLLPFPEIILLDINMPVMNGFEFVERFVHYPREIIKRCCIIILSSSGDSKDIQKAKRLPYVKDY